MRRNGDATTRIPSHRGTQCFDSRGVVGIHGCKIGKKSFLQQQNQPRDEQVAKKAVDGRTRSEK